MGDVGVTDQGVSVRRQDGYIKHQLSPLRRSRRVRRGEEFTLGPRASQVVLTKRPNIFLFVFDDDDDKARVYLLTDDR